MCFDIYWFAHIIIAIFIIGGIIAVANIWLMPLFAPDPNSKIYQTLKIFVGVLIACAIVWLIVMAFECLFAGSLGLHRP